MAKSVLITGASAGLGEALARELARRGYDLVLTARRTDKLEALRDAIRAAGHQGRVELRALDVQDSAAVFKAIEEAWAAMGGLDIVVANAGIAQSARVGTGKFAQDEATIKTNVIGAMATVDAAAGLMKKRGSGGQIVGIASVAGFRGMPKSASYCASKAALATYLQAVRAELADDGIAVTTINPGFIDTDINRGMKNRPFLVSTDAAIPQLADLIEARVAESTLPVWPWRVVGTAMKLMPEALARRVLK